MLNIIGGSYYEICIDPEWDELYGSGLRGVVSLIDKVPDLYFSTYADKITDARLSSIATHLRISYKAHPVEKTIHFLYEHPLAIPTFYPSNQILDVNNRLVIKDVQNVISFGMLEGNAVINADKVIFDPQNPENPESFWNNGSTAEELIMVLNYEEAKTMANATDLDTIANYMHNIEKASMIVIKDGAKGAFLIRTNNERVNIPSFLTTKVWPIGSGDIFTSHFGYELLIRDEKPEEAAYHASQATAYYANSANLPVPEKFNFFQEAKVDLSKEKKVYLAGPFFTMAQRWLINQFRFSLSKSLEVFSPFHDVGLGTAEQVVHLDIQAIQDCDIMLAIVDGLDSGTLYEIGFARALGKPVVAFVENENKNALTMLEGTSCIIENDFSTSIYKTIWEVYKTRN